MSSEEKRAVFELLKTLNVGDCSYADDRVAIAIRQCKQLKDAGFFDREPKPIPPNPEPSSKMKRE
jgi:hypothetical protein